VSVSGSKSKSAIENLSDTDPDADIGGAFQAALSGLITKATGFAGGSCYSDRLPVVAVRLSEG
jgi:hypothetical protein